MTVSTGEKHYFGFVVKTVDGGFGYLLQVRVESADGTVAAAVVTGDRDTDAAAVRVMVENALTAFMVRFIG